MTSHIGISQSNLQQAYVLTRELVALCERHESDPGPATGAQVLTDAEYDAAAAAIIHRFRGEPIWIFGYGSLIWKPVFRPSKSRRATLHGFRRSFCLELRRWRGSPAQPGLMLGLKRGGICEGIAFCLAQGDKKKLMSNLLKRETTGPLGLRCLHVGAVATSQGNVTALTFWAEPEAGGNFIEHDADATADILSRACGHIGSGAAYLLETVSALNERGIHDGYLWDLQARVAAAILKRHS